ARVHPVPAPDDHRRVAELALRDPADIVLVEPVGDLGGLAEVAAVRLLADGHGREPNAATVLQMDDKRASTGYLAVPDAGIGPGVLVLHAWWGLTPFITQVCDRLADEGFVALAPDLLGEVVTDPAEAEARLETASPDQIAHITRSALYHLRQLPMTPNTPVG